MSRKTARRDKKLVVMAKPYTGCRWDAIGFAIFSVCARSNFDPSPKSGIDFTQAALRCTYIPL
jgi:hypothetical protein